MSGRALSEMERSFERLRSEPRLRAEVVSREVSPAWFTNGLGERRFDCRACGRRNWAEAWADSPADRVPLCPNCSGTD